MDIKELLNQLSWQEKDALYRELRSSYVREDVLDRLNERQLDLHFSEDEVATIVKKYVYEGEYDSNLSYWTNIDNLITNEIIETKKHYVERGQTQFSGVYGKKLYEFIDPYELEILVARDLENGCDSQILSYFATKDAALEYLNGAPQASHYYKDNQVVSVTFYFVTEYQPMTDEYEITDIIPIVPNNIELEIDDDIDI